MANQELNETSLKEAAKVFKVLSNQARLSILSYLRVVQREVSVSELVQNLKEAQPIISKQLRILTSYHLVKKRKEKNFVYYSLTDPDLISLIDAMIEHVNHTIKESGTVPDTLY